MLIKLVAVETALVGWLSYWLFLVYANNPSVTQALADKLSKFPQFSFTTIDISVLVVIGVLSILLALKFQRGLRPGIRLERALQMLETLMKRNLFLESQVAELKLEKGHVVSPPSSASGATVESHPVSWERAFRTPIEAGPGPATSPTRPSQPGPASSVLDRTPFLQPAPTARADMKTIAQPASPPKFPSLIPEKQETKPVGTHLGSDLSEKTVSFGPGLNPASWEDSPKHVLETSGILSASSESRKQVPIIPDSTLIKPASIPSPPARISPPPGVIVGPGVSPLSQRKSSLRPFVLPPAAKQGPIGLPRPSSQPKPTPPPIPSTSFQLNPVDAESKESSDEAPVSKPSEPEPRRPEGKTRPPPKKRFPFEEE